MKWVIKDSDIGDIARQPIGENGLSQINQAEEMWKKFPFVNVYVERFPFKTKNNDILPKGRVDEIEGCSNENVRNEKFYVWKLLEYGIKHSLGLEMKDVTFYKKGTKWACNNFEFSLSHSGNIVAVAVARNSVGVDVEEVNVERFAKLPQNKILTPVEQNQLQLDASGLNRIWTAKEAIFKKGENKNFNPTNFSTINEKYTTKTIVAFGKAYYLTVATNDLSFVKYHLGEGIILEK